MERAPIPSEFIDVPDVPPLAKQNIKATVAHLRASSDSNALKNNIYARKKLLEQLRTLVTEGEILLQQALWKDLRKHPVETYLTETQVILQEIQYHLDSISTWTQPKKVPTNLLNLPGSSYVYREPYGLVCIIGTWNFPLHLLFLPLIGSISAGNCSVLRFPDQDTCSNTIAAFIHLIDKFLDKQYIDYIYGGKEETKALLEEKFDMIFATGGPVLGKIVSLAAAENLTPIVLELGGKSPCIVDETADLELAARRIVWGSFLNAGQICLRPDYVLVHHLSGDLFVRKLLKYIVQFFGENAKTSSSYGRVVNKRSFDRIVKILKQDSKYITHGGTFDADSLYIEPTILDFKTDMAAFASSSIMQEETFGPLLPVYYYKDLEQVLQFVNKRPKPLSLSIFTAQNAQKSKIISCTSSGSCSVNDVMIQALNAYMPFGGVGASGSGNYHGYYSFETFSHHKSVIYKTRWLDLAARYQPYTSSKSRLLRFLLTPVPQRKVTMGKISFLIAVAAMVYAKIWSSA